MTPSPAVNATTTPGTHQMEAKNTSTQSTASVNSHDASIQRPSDFTSELQFVSSLAKLQDLERKIHQLRRLLPVGLLEPLLPISNPNRLPTEQPIAESPPQLRNDLVQAARSRLAAVEQFQSMWRSSELKPIWAHVETRMRESTQPLQPTGMWEKDYNILLSRLLAEARLAEQERCREEEEVERKKVQSSKVEWQGTIERFIQREVTGVRVVKTQGTPELSLVLPRAGLVLRIEGVRESDDSGISEWQVSSEMVHGRTPAQLEQAILDCLHARPRKWDLAFLLDMIASYADIKQTSCIKCARLTNDAAQLPTIRRPQFSQSSVSASDPLIFDALHPNCV